MGIFDLLGASDKKIYRSEFNKALRQISELSPKERAYAKEIFEDRLGDGLSKFDIEKVCDELMHRTDDYLESSEVSKIKEKLLQYFK